MLFKSIISLAVFTASAVAEIAFTSIPDAVEAGKSYTITWTSTDLTTPATIILRAGNSANLDTIETVTTNALGGSFSWTPATSLPNAGTYALQITQGADINYSKQFPLTGGSNSPLPTGTVSNAVTSAVGAVSSALSSATAAVSSSISSELASASSVLSSASESASSTASSASASESAAQTSATPSSTPVPANGASGLQSPVAFILCAVAAMLYLN
ncbi:hypothetical protein EJ08DRAFT_655595 [Tothia fuscella]|uniref:Yeast cell wall synthesis Kre9/Knh1-like N-terminal domain-containing protein n=1 Tax=Tothia fuscella TaxID=1048955 RepID=A0A9P4P3I6_9PEZI|nr:hypothetical protein EJ08DRAFT_655595 [Tothia fuscella]